LSAATVSTGTASTSGESTAIRLLKARHGVVQEGLVTPVSVFMSVQRSDQDPPDNRVNHCRPRASTELVDALKVQQEGSQRTAREVPLHL
jgi:hypothetical protein